MSDLPMVTVLIPARNEEADIERCLRAVLAQDYPHDRMEIVLVDGGSSDATTSIAKSVLSVADIEWAILDNSVGTTPSNLNSGLAAATGDLLCRVDARSVLPADYVRLCAETLSTRSDVIVTGGAQVAVVLDGSTRSVGIARALNNRYAMGGSPYRSGAESGPSDTVYLGAFRTDEVRAVGGWDEALLTNQDFELNRRLGRSGVVWFDSRLSVGYVPRRSVAELWTQYHRFGRWKVRYWRHTGDRPQRRQLVALVAPSTLLILFVGLLIPNGHRVSRSVGMAAAAAFGLSALERRGAREPAGDPASRAVASVAMAAVSGGWWSGVVIGAVLDRGDMVTPGEGSVIRIAS